MLAANSQGIIKALQLVEDETDEVELRRVEILIELLSMFDARRLRTRLGRSRACNFSYLVPP